MILLQKNFMKVNMLSVGCEPDFSNVESDSSRCLCTSQSRNSLSQSNLGIKLKNAIVGTESHGGPEGTERRMLRSLSLFKAWLSSQTYSCETIPWASVSREAVVPLVPCVPMSWLRLCAGRKRGGLSC